MLTVVECDFCGVEFPFVPKVIVGAVLSNLNTFEHFIAELPKLSSTYTHKYQSPEPEFLVKVSSFVNAPVKSPFAGSLVFCCCHTYLLTVASPAFTATL